LALPRIDFQVIAESAGSAAFLSVEMIGGRLIYISLQSPQEHRSGSDLNQTVEAKPNKRNAAGNQSGSHRYQAFETVVGNGEVFKVATLFD
jgi:hypothetical protein